MQIDNNKTKNFKIYFVKEENFPLLFDRIWISEINMLPHKLKSVYVNQFFLTVQKHY